MAYQNPYDPNTAGTDPVAPLKKKLPAPVAPTPQGSAIAKVGQALTGMAGAPKPPAPVPDAPPPPTAQPPVAGLKATASPPPPAAAPATPPAAAPVVAPNAGLQTTMAAATPAPAPVAPPAPAPYNPNNVQYDAKGFAVPDDKPDGLISGDSRYNKALDRWESVDLYNARQPENIPVTEGQKRASALATVPEADRQAAMQSAGWLGGGVNQNSDGTTGDLTVDQRRNREAANQEAFAILNAPKAPPVAPPPPPPSTPPTSTPPTQPPLPPPPVDQPPPPPGSGPTTGTPPSPPKTPTPPPPLSNSLMAGGGSSIPAIGVNAPPKPFELSKFGPGNDLQGTQINPTQTDRFQLVNDRLKAFDAESGAKLAADMRNAVKGNAAMGRLGSGMLRTDTGNLLDSAARSRYAFGTNALANAAEGTIGDQANQRGELRTERGFQTQMARQAVQDRINQWMLEQGAQAQDFGQGVSLASLGFGGNTINSLFNASGLAGADAGAAGSTISDILSQYLARRNAPKAA